VNRGGICIFEMISETTKRALEVECRRLCEAWGLRRAYFAQVLGPRRHFLAGYGPMEADRPEPLRLSESLVLLWHGELTVEAREALRYDLEATVRRVERELADREAAGPEGDGCIDEKGNT